VITLKGSVQVDRDELRNALVAVRPHAAPNKRGSDVLPLNRVRLIIDHRYVHVVAASGATMALALVGILDDTRDEPFEAADAPYVVDLAPDLVADVLKVFPQRRVPRDADPREGRIEIRFSDGEVVFEDGPGGLLPGRSRLGFTIVDPNSEFPNVRGLLGRAQREAGSTEVAKPLVVGGAVLKLWEVAGRAYGQPVRISGSGDTTSPAYLVEVGPMFIGSFGSRSGDDIAVKQRATWRAEMLRILPDVGDDEVVALASLLGGDVDDQDDAGDDVTPGQLATDDEGDDD
jgi:hypothetical protein